jgi:hypothetical protein
MKHSPIDTDTSTTALATADTEAPAQMPAQTDPMVATIEKVALDPNADIEKLERMLDMKERLDDRAREDAAREAEREFYRALAAAQTQVPVVVRTRKNSHSNYTYADLADIETQAMPIIRQHGFAVAAWSGTGAPDGHQRVHLRVSHVSGHSHEIQDDFPLDGAGLKGGQNKTAIQSKGSTTSYGRRYLLCGYFGIATADDDGSRREASGPETISAKDAAEVSRLVEETGTKLPDLLTFAKSESVEEIPAAKAGQVLQLLRSKAAKIAKEGSTDG